MFLFYMCAFMVSKLDCQQTKSFFTHSLTHTHTHTHTHVCVCISLSHNVRQLQYTVECSTNTQNTQSQLLDLLLEDILSLSSSTKYCACSNGLICVCMKISKINNVFTSICINLCWCVCVIVFHGVLLYGLIVW